jgi:hypothetical protein
MICVAKLDFLTKLIDASLHLKQPFRNSRVARFVRVALLAAVTSLFSASRSVKDVIERGIAEIRRRLLCSYGVLLGSITTRLRGGRRDSSLPT